MNNDRRKKIDAAIKSAEAMRAEIEALKELICDIKSAASDLHSEIDSIKDEEQEYYDNMPESLQSGEKGQAAEAAVNILEEAISKLEEFDNIPDDVIDIEEIIGMLDDSKHQ